jgi:hypothetical protein
LRTLFTVTATTWVRQIEPEGWIPIHDKPRQFKTRVGADLFVAGMTAADEAAAKRRGESNRTTYEITEETQP